MNAEGSAAEHDVVRKLARGSLFSRLKHSRHPLKLVAVPRDHVAGDRQRGDALLAGRFAVGNEALPLADLDFASVGAQGSLAEQLQGFSWLRDLAAAASREKGARLAEAVVGRWLLAHGTRIDSAWAPHLWGERILFWTAYAPYILTSSDGGYRSALLNTLARGARHLDSTADKAPAVRAGEACRSLRLAARLLSRRQADHPRGDPGRRCRRARGSSRHRHGR